MFQKPTFGSSATSSFGSFNAGASTSSPFSSFKPATGGTAFGAPPGFGAAATQPTTGGGLFGASNTSGLFGASATPAAAPAFGSNTNSFGFGATTSTGGGGLFGNNTGSSLFGNTQNTSAFGAKPAGFGFGSTPTASTSSGGLFGSTPSAGSGLFGQQPSAMGAGGLFSNTTGAFGSVTGQASGTGHVKYNPVVGSDVIVKAGTSQNISVKHHCITCMKEYEHKSLEELRLEDYQAGRKGAAAPMFGGFAAQTENKPLFPTAFGQTATTTSSSVFGGGSLGTGTGFGQTSTFSFGGNAQPATNTGGLFGASKPTFGATTTPGTGLFGATTTQAPTFGTTTNTFGFGTTTQAQSGGLFAAKPATSGFGGAATAGFGGGGAFGGGLFQAKPAAPAFGTAQPAFGNISTGFGANTSTSGGLFNTNNAFGKPATSTPAFGFNTQPTLGGGLGTGLGANQAKPTVGFGALGSSSLFTQPQQNTMFRADGLGGAGGLGTGGLGGGLGGGGLFGGTALGGPALGVGANSALNTSGLTGAAPSNAHEQMLTLCARPYGDSPLYKDLLPAAEGGEPAARPTNPAAVKALVERARPPPPPRAALRLLPRPLPADKKSLFDGLEESDASLEDKLSLKPSRKRLVLRPGPGPGPRVDAQPARESHPVRDSVRSEESPRTNGTADIPDAPDRPPSVAQQTNAEDSDKNNSWLSSSKIQWNEKEKSIDNDPTPHLYPNIDKELHAHISERRASWLTTKSLRKPLVSNTDSADNSVRELGVRSPERLSLDKENIESLSVSEEENVPPRDMPPHPAGVKLTRPGYYTIPSLEQMIGYMRPDGSCVVPHLTIGRHNYGNVFYDCEIDVAGLDLDALVHFLNKEVIVYPEDAVKPPVGSGLNRRAVVTLDRVWPRDKTQKTPITDCDRLIKMDYESKLRRVCDKHDTKFIEYRPQTGSWVFRVEHFSKYGLTDSDEEDEAPTPEVMKRQLVNQTLHTAAPVSAAPPAAVGLGGVGPAAVGLGGGGVGPAVVGLGGVGPGDSLSAMHQTSLNLLNGAGKAFEMDTTEDNVEATSLYQESRAFGVKSPTSELARLENRQSHHVQLMKASLYADAEVEDEMSVCSGDQLVPATLSRGAPSERSPILLQPSTDDAEQTPSAATDSAAPEAPMPPLLIQPHSVVLQYHRKVQPFKQTLAGAVDAAYLADMAVCRARHFRVGFSPGRAMLYLTTSQLINSLSKNAEPCELDKYVSGRAGDDWSEPRLARLALGGDQEFLSRQMQDLIECSALEGDTESSCGRLVVKDRKRLLQAFLSYEATEKQQSKWGLTAGYCRQVWRLCDALWGADLDNDGVPNNDMLSVVERYRKLLAWLTEAVSSITDEELAEPTKGEDEDAEDGHSRRVWTLVVGGRLVEACHVALQNRDRNMAVLLAQAAGCDSFRGLLSRQLAQWRECGADALMSQHRLDVLRLLAGQAAPPGRVLQLDWLRALHVTARYLCPQVPTLERIVRLYEGFFRKEDDGEDDLELAPTLDSDEMGMKPPLPPYTDTYYLSQDGEKHQVLDLRYELIRARATNGRPKLRPASYTPDPLDYSLCFLLSAWLGQPSAAVVASAACQLEACGLWHLAVAALLYHPAPRVRDRLVREVISRHVPCNPPHQHQQHQHQHPGLALLASLRIPDKWIHLAQAHRAKYENKPLCEAQHLIAAQQWNAAHRVLLDELLPDAVLADDVKNILPLLSALSEAASRNEVSGWCGGGMALHCWTQAKEQILEISSSNERGEASAGLEALLPLIMAAFRALAHWKPTCSRQSAAHAELGGRLAQLGSAAGLRPARLAAALLPARLPPAAAAAALRQITTDIAEQASELCMQPSVRSPRSSHRSFALHT